VMGVRVDDACDWLGCHALHALDDGRAEAGKLRVDEGDAGVGDEHRDVAAAECRSVAGAGTGDDVQVVLDLLDLHRLDGLRRGTRRLARDGHRHPAHDYEYAEHHHTLHESPPGKKT